MSKGLRIFCIVVAAMMVLGTVLALFSPLF